MTEMRFANSLFLFFCQCSIIKAELKSFYEEDLSRIFDFGLIIDNAAG